jgi:hypothetical protein
MKSRTVAWVLFVLTGIYCLCVSLLGRVEFAYGYKPEAHSAVMLMRYLQPVLVLPLFLLALVPRKWATFPLWALCISIAVFPFLIRDENMRIQLGYWSSPSGIYALKEIAIVMVIPVMVQFAAMLRMHSQPAQ